MIFDGPPPGMDAMRSSLLFAAMVIISAGCARDGEQTTVTLATDPCLRDCGLFKVLVPMFETKTGIEVKIAAVGSAQALTMGRAGEADLLLTDLPAAEQQFMEDGHGASRRSVMLDDLVLVGPKSESTGIAGMESVVDAFRRIQATKTLFISCGDHSGLHRKEQAIWKKAGIKPGGKTYISANRGTAEVLRQASKQGACALTDRATFLLLRNQLQLKILCEGDPLLRNPWVAIVVSREKHPAVRNVAAKRFAEFLVSAEAQAAIAKFRIGNGERPVFVVRESATKSKKSTTP